MERSNSITFIQALLLGLAALGLVAVTLLVVDGRRQGGQGSQETQSARESSPVTPAAYTRFAMALSDSLHDETEALVAWLVAAEDTTGTASRLAFHDRRVRAAIAALESEASSAPDREFELLLGLFLEYLDAPTVGASGPGLRTAAGEAYLSQIGRSRSEIEPLLLRHLGDF
jgi:hypothetical protein